MLVLEGAIEIDVNGEEVAVGADSYAYLPPASEEFLQQRRGGWGRGREGCARMGRKGAGARLCELGEGARPLGAALSSSGGVATDEPLAAPPARRAAPQRVFQGRRQARRV
jgi:hypothetical protein